MANKEHLDILKQGITAWQQWTEKNPSIRADLRRAELMGADLNRFNLREADLSWANLRWSKLRGVNLGNANLDNAYLIDADMTDANLMRANLTKAKLMRANLTRAKLDGASLSGAFLTGAEMSGAEMRWVNLRKANLSEANLSDVRLPGADLSEANLSKANLFGADIRRAALVQTDFSGANLSHCYVFGISAWDVILQNTTQTDLIITQYGEPIVTVDNLEVAQFIYLLLHNEKIRDVIDTIGKKAVLILGRFTPERKAVLDALREELRKRNYTPILFDFEKPSSKDLTETVATLANLSRFIIADITNAKSIPQELQAIVPNLPSVAVQPIILSSEHEYAMFEHFKRYPWVLPVYQYETQELLLAALSEKVIQPVEEKVEELRSVN